MRCACAVVLLSVLLCGCSTINQGTQDRRQSVFKAWDNLNRQEALRNYSTICTVADTVLELSSRLPRRECQWYHAIAYFTRARAEARLDQPLKARRDILLALDSGYRNDAVMEADTLLMVVVGRIWFDSVIKVWAEVQRDRRKRWTPQLPIVLTPHDEINNKPIFIALHGGNGSYDEFSSHFTGLPDSMKAVFVFPSGPIKYSPVCHSWPKESILSDSIIFSAIEVGKRVPGVDTAHIVLLGYSQGAATAIGFSLRHPSLVSETILFSGFTSEEFSDSQLKTTEQANTKIYAVSGSGDAPMFLTSIRSLSSRCKTIGIPFYFEERPAMMHNVPVELNKEIAAAWHWLTMKE